MYHTVNITKADVKMAEKITLDTILSKGDADWAHKALSNGVLTKRSLLSESKLRIINALIKADPDLKKKPKYVEVREIAKLAGITDNISQSSIKSILDILFSSNSTSQDTKTLRVNLIDYAVKTRLLPIALNEKMIDEEKQLVRWRQTVRNVIAPVILAEMFVKKTMLGKGKAANTYANTPRLLRQMEDMTKPNADGILVVLENSEFGVKKRSLQQVSKSKIGRMLTYKAIEDIHEAGAYLYEGFVIDISEKMHQSYDQIADYSIGALQAVESLRDVGRYSDDHAEMIVSSYMRSLIYKDESMDKSLSMFD